MVGPFILDYLVFVFLAALGVLQMVAAYSALRGLLFVKSRPHAFLVGLATTALAFIWFFLSEPRNVPDTDGGLDGNEMAGLFSVAAGTALMLTLLVTSISNRGIRGGGQPLYRGLDTLRETTYLNALLSTLKDLWKRYGT